ncbi:FxSxx-COOH system tetratricopeptide repeat protein [Phytohabitans maris]|nr:FxSxx-COOH system tetratricopeptide repeat protein [Phytohabitans sp. ZYX-F-186]
MTGAGSTPGQIVTFYSYKGGTGRTMAVANIAWILASNGLRVLTLDWDLESPGLHRYFRPFLVDKELRSSPGVIDLIRNFAAATLQPRSGTEPDTEAWPREYARISDYAASLEWPFPGNGTIDFVPAGQQDSAYSLSVSTFDWASFYEKRKGGTFLTILREEIRREYDYVLLDSRTGLSDAAGVCTVLLPDIVVDCFTMSTQSIDGAVAVAHSIQNRRRGAPVRVLPVPMKVEDGEQIKLEAGRDFARIGFDHFLSQMSPGDISRYWGDVEIPYKPYYAYEEILAAFGDRPHQENSLLAAFERLAYVLTDGQVSEVGAIDEAERRRWLAQFERPRAGLISTVLVSYASVDRIWAEWIVSELSTAGVQATYQEIDSPAVTQTMADLSSTMTSTARVMVLLSPEYVQSDNAALLWKTLSDLEATNLHRYLVPLRPVPARVVPPFADRPPVDLFDRSEEEARDALLNSTGRQPTTVAPRQRTGTAGHRPRFPSARPPVSKVPPRNAAFTGRNDILENLRDELAGTVTVVMPQALYGLGGVGKTQVAREYANRFAAHYDVVWWISAEQPGMIRAELAELGEKLGIPMEDNDNATARTVLDALERGEPYRRYLLIYDNVHDPADVREYIPQGPGDVLLTSRNPAWSSQARPIHIGVFARGESIALLRKKVKGLAEVDADQVAEKLGDLPLAIEQAAAWLAETAMPVSEYLRELDRQLPRVLAENPPPGYQETAAAIWLLSLDRLRQQRPAAAKLMELCSFFGPEPIPTALLYSDRCVKVLAEYDVALRDLKDRMLVGALIRDIGRFALAQPGAGPSSIQVHRLVQAVIRERLSPQDQRENRRHVHEILAAANPKNPDEPSFWDVYDEIWPHLVPPKTIESTTPEVRQLVIDVVRYLYRRGYYVSCQELAEETQVRWSAADILDDDPMTLVLRFHLANTVRARGDYTASLAQNQDILARQERTLGPEHPYTLLTARSLGADLRTFGRYAQARDLDELTLVRFRRVFGEDDQQTLAAANNLAVTLRLVGDFRRATELDEETLRRGREVLGERHPLTLQFAANYGRDLREIGDFPGSKRVLEQTFEHLRTVLGDEHADTLRAARSMAVTLRKMGDLEVARDLTRDTLTKHEHRHGPEHLDTLACSLNLACDDSALNDDRAAQQRAEAVLGRYQRLVGEDHPFTLACANDLAIFIRRQGDHDTARSLSERVVERLVERLGPDHPYAIASQLNLANDVYAMAEYDRARDLDEQAFARFSAVLGEEHPDTLAAAVNLALSRRATGDTARARSLSTGVLARIRRTLGDDHPNTAAARTGQTRFNCDIEPPSV